MPTEPHRAVAVESVLRWGPRTPDHVGMARATFYRQLGEDPLLQAALELHRAKQREAQAKERHSDAQLVLLEAERQTGAAAAKFVALSEAKTKREQQASRVLARGKKGK